MKRPFGLLYKGCISSVSYDGEPSVSNGIAYQLPSSRLFIHRVPAKLSNRVMPCGENYFRKKGVESGWSAADREGIAIAMAMENAPQTVAMELQKKYAERYDWLVKEFTDLAFTFMTSFL